MTESKVLYQMKKLEKRIIRLLFEDCTECLESREIFLTPTQMQIIDYMLEHCEKNIYQKDLEDVLKLRRATVSGVLQTMEKNGLIKRITNTEDARTKQIFLHEKAKNLFLEHSRKLKEIEAMITKDVSNEEMQTFLKVLESMQENMKKVESVYHEKGEKI